VPKSAVELDYDAVFLKESVPALGLMVQPHEVLANWCRQRMRLDHVSFEAPFQDRLDPGLGVAQEVIQQRAPSSASSATQSVEKGLPSHISTLKRPRHKGDDFRILPTTIGKV
jgi:hypothetical protein